MKVDVILGLQWGDEGKGKIVDVFTPDYDIIARFQGGPNAGHTIIFDDQKFILHTIPSGIFHEQKLNLIGNGVIIDPYILFQEIDSLHQARMDPKRNLLISRRSHLILPTHRLLDAAYEEAKGRSKIGSTLKGIGPAYTDKYGRNGLRTGCITEPGFNRIYDRMKQQHLEIIRHHHFDFKNYLIDGLPFDAYEEAWLEAVRKLKDYRIIDSEYFLNNALDRGEAVLAEGAQGTLLDIDFGSYPFVTSSNTISSGACSGLGLSPHRIGTIYGVFKAYCTRVGSGPFPTELEDATGESLRKLGHEFGSTTGRPRRCGWLDLPILNYAIMLNGIDRLIMMKADVLDEMDPIKVCTAYRYNGAEITQVPFDLSDDKLEPVYHELPGWKCHMDGEPSMDALPAALKDYIAYIEQATGRPLDIVSLGPDRKQTVFRHKQD